MYLCLHSCRSGFVQAEDSQFVPDWYEHFLSRGLKETQPKILYISLDASVDESKQIRAFNPDFSGMSSQELATFIQQADLPSLGNRKITETERLKLILKQVSSGHTSYLPLCFTSAGAVTSHIFNDRMIQAVNQLQQTSKFNNWAFCFCPPHFNIVITLYATYNVHALHSILKQNILAQIY